MKHTNLGDYATSIVRTATPVVVGWLLSSAIGPYVDPEIAQEAVAALISVAYYGAVRFVEVKLGKEWAGWLLGLAVPPTYRIDTASVEDDA